MSPKKLQAAVIGLLCAGWLSPGQGIASGQTDHRAKPAGGGSATVPFREESLPPEAISRLGSPQSKPAKDDIHTLLFTPDGKLLISQSSKATRVWDTSTGRHIHQWPS